MGYISLKRLKYLCFRIVSFILDAGKLLERNEVMKVTVVGYWGGYPAQGEATSGYLFEHNGFSLLVDCGSGVLAQLQKYIQPTDLDAVILSHYHHDHVADVGVLQYARQIHYYLGNQTKELPFYGHTEDKKGFESLTHKGFTKGVVYDPETSLTVGPFTISFLKTKHPVPCYAMRITAGNETVVYTADSSYQQEFIDFAKDADLLISECNFYGHQDGTSAGHMTSKENGHIAHEANVKKLILTHLPHYGEHAQLIDEAKEFFNGDIELAKCGVVFDK